MIAEGGNDNRAFAGLCGAHDITQHGIGASHAISPGKGWLLPWPGAMRGDGDDIPATRRCRAGKILGQALGDGRIGNKATQAFSLRKRCRGFETSETERRQDLVSAKKTGIEGVPARGLIPGMAQMPGE